jgi:hypothetical protein
MPNSTKPTGGMDGVFGNETHGAVRKFQLAQTVLPDGVIGTNTMERLLGEIERVLGRAIDFMKLIQGSPILVAASGEINVSWKTNPPRVKDYFRLSAKLGVHTSPEARLEFERKTHTTSWCSFFVHWALGRAGVQPLPRQANLNVGDSISRFVDTYMTQQGKKPLDFTPGKYEPQPGDMYSMPFSPLAKNPGTPVNHIGLVVGRVNPGDPKSPIRTLDGNSITASTLHQWLGGKGGGMVCMNLRDETPWINHYIPRP